MGTLLPSLGARKMGTVTKVSHQIGDFATKGTFLVEFDDEEWCYRKNDRLKDLYVYYRGNCFSATSAMGGKFAPPPPSTVCSNGFYADLSNHLQMQQNKSCLKYVVSIGSFEVL